MGKLYDFCKTGDLEQIKYLVRKEIGCYSPQRCQWWKACENMAIRIASEYGHLEIVKYIVSLGCDPTVRDNWAIRWAAEYGNLEVVKYLVGLGCDPMVENNWAIRWASRNDHLDVVKYLAGIGCNPIVKNNWAIRRAAENGHLEVVKYLFKIGCDHEVVNHSIKYEVLQEYKIKLLIMLNKRVRNQYLQMEILKTMLPQFTEYKIMNVLEN